MKSLNLCRDLCLVLAALAAPLLGGCVASTGDAGSDPAEEQVGQAEQAQCDWAWGCGLPVSSVLQGSTIGITPYIDPTDYLIAGANSCGFGAYPGNAANFTVVPGLAGNGCFGLESVAYPGSYLGVGAGVVGLHTLDSLAPGDGTFCGTTFGKSLALYPYSAPNQYLTYDNSTLTVGGPGINPYINTAALFRTQVY